MAAARWALGGAVPGRRRLLSSRALAVTALTRRNSYKEDETLRPKTEAAKPSVISRRPSRRLEVEGCGITSFSGLNVVAKAVSEVAFLLLKTGK